MSTPNGSDPSGNPGGTGTDPVNTPGGNDPPKAWYSGIEDSDIRGFAELKGWKDPSEAVRSYRDLEKFQGLPPERLAKVPEKEDAEGWKAFNQRFGWAAPADPKDYALPVPDGHGRDFADAMQAKFHELGVPPELGRQIAGAANDFTLSKMQADEQAVELEHAQDLTKLRSEWGGTFNEMQQLADRASEQVVKSGWLSDVQMEGIRDVLGTAGFMRLFANLGSQQGEAKFIDSTTPTALGPMSPDAAKARMTQLQQDKEWFGRYEAGGVKERQEYAHLRHILATAAAGA